MKKLLCIACLLASILFVNSADAAIGSPARRAVSVNTVSVSTACTTCGQVNRVHILGHGFRHHGFRHHAFRRHGFRHHGFRHHGFRHHAFRRHGFRHHGFRGHGFHGRRFACTRCGR